MRKLIVIADWANDDLSNQEFLSAIEGNLIQNEWPYVSFVGCTPSSIHGSFLLSQIVETEERYGRPLKTVIFINVDDRSEGKEGELIILKLFSGIYILGPNADKIFSLIKDKVEKIFTYEDLEKRKTQFRSRDLYSRICAHFIEEIEDKLILEETHNFIIPSLEGFYIGHIDNFGNIKTTIPLSYLKGKKEYGEELIVEINHIKRKVRFVRGLFLGEPNVLIIYPGSSGKIDDPFLEISVWRDFSKENQTTGKDFFNSPLPGQPIKIIF